MKVYCKCFDIIMYLKNEDKFSSLRSVLRQESGDLGRMPLPASSVNSGNLLNL